MCRGRWQRSLSLSRVLPSRQKPSRLHHELAQLQELSPPSHCWELRTKQRHESDCPSRVVLQKTKPSPLELEKSEPDKPAADLTVASDSSESRHMQT